MQETLEVEEETKELNVSFVECPFFVPNGKGVEIKLYRKGNTIYGEPILPNGEKITIESPTLRPKDVWYVCAKWVRDYWTSLGYTVQMTRMPKDPIKKSQYIEIKKKISVNMREQLIEAGLL